MELEKQIIIEKLKFLKYKEDVLDFDYDDEGAIVSFEKDSQKSETVRKSGNKLFSKKNHDKIVHEKIWILYTKSIALAMNGSEQLAAAYANRSAFLLHLKKYDECLLDIERALKITKSSSLKVKLFCRQSECYVFMQEGKATSSLIKAKYWLQRVESSSDMVKLSEIIIKTDKVVEDNIPDFGKKDTALEIPYNGNLAEVKYNNKYRKHLVATRSIQPGEFICAEKFYVTSVNGSKSYAYCSHCLAACWTLIPCDQCSFYMFCSEECKAEAWKEYHDVECSIKFPYNPTYFTHYLVQLSIKSLIKGFKETKFDCSKSSIKNLKDLVLELEKSTGKESSRKFAFNSFQTLITSTFSKSKEKLSRYALEAVRALIKLIENTDIFRNVFKISGDLEDLIQHEDIIFIGSLLLRLMGISDLNARNTLHFTEACKGRENYDECLNEYCCSRGKYISLLTTVIHHSCNNNVSKICSNDGRVMYYALQPINKNDQIKTSYCLNFTIDTKTDRQEELKRLFEIDCNCIACQKNWPTAKNMMQVRLPDQNALKCLEILAGKRKKLTKVIENPNYRPSKKTREDFAKDIECLFKITTQPHVVADYFTLVLTLIFENTYYSKLNIPSQCKLK